MSLQGFCRVKAPARLHLGFIDMHGGLGRKFGSVGVAIDEPYVELSARCMPSLRVTGKSYQRVHKVAERFLQVQKDVGINLCTAHIKVHQIIPNHIGFGSGTQISLAVARSLAHLSGFDISNNEIMRAMGRGRRSGVGVSTFEFGGIVVDGGKGDSDLPPPLLSHLSLPSLWRVILMTDDNATGIHGLSEFTAFDRLPKFSSSCAAYLSRIVLMELLPSVVESDFSFFADATMRLQDCIGDYFTMAQGGRYASPKVGRVIEYLRENGIKGIGQSSWGPTGFVFVPDNQSAQQIIDMIKNAFAEDLGVSLSVVQFNNEGALISGE